MRPLACLLLATAPLPAEVQIYPTLHLTAVVGDTSASSFEDIGGHAHDPNDQASLQGADLALNLVIDDWLAGFTNLNIFTTSDNELEVELEESFLKFQNLPGGFEIRGGRFLNRLGLQNNRHLHSWKFVNANLSTSQLLGEEGLTTDGFEVTWLKEFDKSFLALTASYGKAFEEDEEGEEESESAENALFNQDLITVRALFNYNHTDFHQHQLGVNGAWGDNGFGRDTSLHSIDYTYTWRENGLEPGGRALAIGAEYYQRNIEWVDSQNPSNQGTSNQFSWMAFAQYRFAEKWIADIRYEHLQGRSAGPRLGGNTFAFSSAERDRLSLALTREFQHKETDSYLRLQYSHDDLEDRAEDSIFLQIGFNFGQSHEVR